MKWRTDVENAPRDKPILGYGEWEGEWSNWSEKLVCVVMSNNGVDWRVQGSEYYSPCLNLKAWANITDLPGSLFP